MAIHDKYLGPTVSRYLPPGDRSWAQVVYQTQRPITDADLQLGQDASEYVRSLLLDRSLPSGWLRGQTRHDALTDFMFMDPGDPGFAPNTFWMRRRTAVVAGHPVVVEYTNTNEAGWNAIELEPPPLLGGAPPDVKRTDFVFLEVWLALVADSANASGAVEVTGVPTVGDTITIDGIPLVGVASAPAPGEFQIGADVFTTAANIVAAINDPVNGLDTLVTASAGGTDVVTIRANTPGTVGNSITLAATGADLVASGATLSGGLDEPNKPTQDSIYRHGNVLADPSVNLPDDIADPVIGSETTRRVQVQYRIRVTGQTEAVNYQTQADGFSNAFVLAQGATSAPVAGYRFVPADRTTVVGDSSAVAYGREDGGLWVAGDGSSSAANDLGSVDGFVYAIPLGFVFRRNDAYLGGTGVGFDPLTNTNGGAPTTHGGFANPAVGAIPAGISDRPDGSFADAIVADDLLDLRRHVLPAGVDMAAELEYQMHSLLDGMNRTWAIDGADKNTLGSGSGDVSSRYLVCNQVGRAGSHGGNPPISGDTNRGTTIRNFDHVARRFGDAPVVERVVFEVRPDYTSGTHPGRYVVQANGAYVGWAEDDAIHIDLATLNATTIGDFDPATITYTGAGPSNASIDDFAPPGTTVVDIPSVYHDDGHYATPVDQRVQVKRAEGLGTPHVVIVLDRNDTLVNGGDPGNPDHRVVGDSGTDDGSSRRIFVELELAYPLGSGLTDTPEEDLSPDTSVYVNGPILENDATQRPDDWEGLLPPAFRPGYREVKVEYVANDGSGAGSNTPIVDSIVSRTSTELVFPRRVFGSGLMMTGVTDSVAAQPHDIDVGSTEFGSSSRLVVLDTSGGPSGSPLSGGGQTLCAISYFAQDPLPNWGAAGGGYQVGVYYRSVATPTVGVRAGALSQMPDPLEVEPLVMAKGLWTGQAGKGSMDLTFPFTSPLDHIAVNDGGTSTFPGEWYFAGTASVSIDDFDAEVGLLNLHAFVPIAGTGNFSLQGKDKDIEFRSFYAMTDPAAYRPTVMSQPLSGVVRHKVFSPFLARATEDSVLFRKNEVLLVVVSRWAELDAENTVRFIDGAENRSAAAVYRTRNLLIVVGE